MSIEWEWSHLNLVGLTLLVFGSLFIFHATAALHVQVGTILVCLSVVCFAVYICKLPAIIAQSVIERANEICERMARCKDVK